MLLLTGVAGFIGFHAARLLLDAGWDVRGLDEVNNYYNPALKRARLALLKVHPNFHFTEGSIADPSTLDQAAPPEQLTHILHLAAQAGVRYSLENPFEYERCNSLGHLTILEHARKAKTLKHLTYASSSSVYGDRLEGPFRETDRCDAPQSLYAATKRSCELMSETYARLYNIPQTGLRFFTVYGSWGRPDMAYWSFTDRILSGEPIQLFGDGKLARDFTYIDDIAATLPVILETPPQGAPPHTLVNLGNSSPCTVIELVSAIEAALGKTANVILTPPQLGDVTNTFADTSRAATAYGFAPKVRLTEGIARYVEWRLANRDF